MKINQLDEVGFDADVYDGYLCHANSKGIHIVHTRNGYGNMGGYTFAWQRTTDNIRGRMVRVAVSFCSEKDQFNRKVGSWNALSNFIEGKSILLPVGDEDNTIIVENLRAVFHTALFKDF
jgi:hypothetical protein